MPRPITVTARGSVQLPSDLREALHIQPGQQFTAVAKGNVIMLVPVQDVRELRGAARGADTSGYRER
ncbi:MAG: AbrB/MazE/SpoVT family DNA-binding domain-containing protein [Pseudomonadota bacterium]|nr:AbrB/MazE/SpoVT family DNA-binding domain-containing protein [Pseudomonadota bacterium]